MRRRRRGRPPGRWDHFLVAPWGADSLDTPRGPASFIDFMPRGRDWCPPEGEGGECEGALTPSLPRMVEWLVDQERRRERAVLECIGPAVSFFCEAMSFCVHVDSGDVPLLRSGAWRAVRCGASETPVLTCAAQLVLALRSCDAARGATSAAPRQRPRRPRLSVPCSEERVPDVLVPRQAVVCNARSLRLVAGVAERAAALFSSMLPLRWRRAPYPHGLLCGSGTAPAVVRQQFPFGTSVGETFFSCRRVVLLMVRPRSQRT